MLKTGAGILLGQAGWGTSLMDRKHQCLHALKASQHASTTDSKAQPPHLSCACAFRAIHWQDE